MSTHVATFSELLKKSFPITKKRIWVFVLGMLLTFVVWIVPNVFSSIFFSLMKVPSIGSIKPVFWVLGCIFAIVATAVQMIPSLYMLVIVLEHKSGVIASFKKACTFIIRSFIASIWIGLRSFVWIAIIGSVLVMIGTVFKGQQLELVFIAIGSLLILAGVIIGLILMPRFAFAMVILVKENCSARACVRESYKRTDGYWGKIVGNSVLYSLMSFGIVILFVASLGVVGLIAGVLQHFGHQMLSMLLMIPTGIVFFLALIAFIVFFSLLGTVFNVELYETIHAHPIHRKMKKA
jgi:hypothetical protein